MTTEKKPVDSSAQDAPQPAPAVKAAKPIKAAKPVKVAKPTAAPKAAVAPEPAAKPVVVDAAPPKKDKKDKKKAKKKDKKNKEAVIIRFDDAQLPQIDASAEALGLSRAAWVRMVVAQALTKA